MAMTMAVPLFFFAVLAAIGLLVIRPVLTSLLLSRLVGLCCIVLCVGAPGHGDGGRSLRGLLRWKCGVPPGEVYEPTSPTPYTLYVRTDIHTYIRT